MPSKKVISIFIIAAALVLTIIIIFEPDISRENALKNVNAGSLSSGGDVRSVNINWQADLENISPAPLPEEASSTETLTDQFSRSFMANYLSLKQSGTYDEVAAQDLVQKSAVFLESSQQATYSLKDIVINSDNSKPAVLKYGNDLGYAFKINKPSGEAKNEIVIFGQMMQNKDQSKVLELRNIAEVYKNTSISLSKITVPSNFAGNHLQMLNALNSIALAVFNMAQGLADPMKSLQAMASYKQNMDLAFQLHNEIGTSLLKAGANYKQGTDGYFFFFGI